MGFDANIVPSASEWRQNRDGNADAFQTKIVLSL